MRSKLFLINYLLVLSLFTQAQSALSPHSPPKKPTRETLRKSIVQGWNTWDNRNILSHVLLPDKAALHLKLEDSLSSKLLGLSFTGNRTAGSEKVITLAHTPDGSYTAFRIQWQSLDLLVQSVAEGRALDVLLTPLGSALNEGWVRAEPYYIYQQKGKVNWDENKLSWNSSEGALEINLIGKAKKQDKGVRIDLQHPVGFSTNSTSIKAIQQKIRRAEIANWEREQAFGNMREAYHIIQNAINWLVVYDPDQDRVLTPVSRPWSFGWGKHQEGGFVQFCWDNFFVAYMHTLESKDLAYNEVFELTRLIDELGFVPNYAGPKGENSKDRSQPPVGSIMVKEIYKKYRENWFVEQNFEQLLKWNRWWANNRDIDGYLTWGSNPFQPTKGKRQLTQNNHKAASNESGLDNTPMYDQVPFDTSKHLFLQADVGLLSLYIADCKALAELANVIGKSAAAKELLERADHYSKSLKSLWHDEFGLFLNKRLDTGNWNFSISPTNFYPLLAKIATPQQAQRMVKEHLYNPKEFWGEYVLPSIARNDPAYTGRDYWRGSIWAPMNFLVYMGLRNYDFPQARADLASKSLHLLTKNWRMGGFVHENYHAETGRDPGYQSDYFYHWGALLGMINLIEHGKVLPTEQKI